MAVLIPFWRALDRLRKRCVNKRLEGRRVREAVR